MLCCAVLHYTVLYHSSGAVQVQGTAVCRPNNRSGRLSCRLVDYQSARGQSCSSLSPLSLERETPLVLSGSALTGQTTSRTVDSSLHPLYDTNDPVVALTGCRHPSHLLDVLLSDHLRRPPPHYPGRNSSPHLNIYSHLRPDLLSGSSQLRTLQDSYLVHSHSPNKVTSRELPF